MKLILLLILASFSTSLWAQPWGALPGKMTPVYKNSAGELFGFYVYLPRDYVHGGTKKYPLILALHGAGETGDGNIGTCPTYNGLCEVHKIGIMSRIKGGMHLDAIVIAPQNSGVWTSVSSTVDTPQKVINFLDSISAKLTVDTKRISMTGMSMGGWGTVVIGRRFADKFAALAPVCTAASPSATEDLNLRGKPMWFFHNYGDNYNDNGFHVYWTKSLNIINNITITGTSIMANAPYKYTIGFPGIYPTLDPATGKYVAPYYDTDGKAIKDVIGIYSQKDDKMTWFDGQKTTASLDPDHVLRFTLYAKYGHNAWSDAYNTAELYTWMLNQSLDGPSVEANVAPQVNVGVDKTITLPTNTLSISATVSDADGVVDTLQWSKLEGDAVSMSGSTTANLSLSNLLEGRYVFRLLATDNDGATSSDDVVVTVLKANSLPVAKAGVDQVIQLPANTAILDGSLSSDTEGALVSYAWTKISGGTVTLSGQTSSKLSLSALVEGTYVFRLTVKDSAGASASDDVSVIVKPAVVENKIPTVSAPGDRTIRLPDASENLSASASDADGSIAKYSWSKISGGAVTLTNASAAVVTLSGYAAGDYTFRVTVTDNSGATASDDVVVKFLPVPETITTEATISVTQGEYFFNSSLAKATTADILNRTGEEDAIYQSHRYGASYAQFPVVNGDYEVTIKFAELHFGAADRRKFNVAIEGLEVLRGFDIFAEAGGKYMALDKTFRTTVADGSLRIDFTKFTRADGTIADQPAYSAIALKRIVENKVPTVTTPADRTLRLPDASEALTAKAADVDGTIARYSWSKVSGPAVTMTNTTSATLTLSGYVAGEYVFRVTVTDNAGAMASDDMIIKVLPVPQTVTSEALITVSQGEYFFNSSLAKPVTADILNRSGTDDAIYQIHRYGASYAHIPVANGNYEVIIKFAEVHFGSADRRKFNVAIEGAQVLNGFDIFAEAGGKYMAIDKSFKTSVADGVLRIDFTKFTRADGTFADQPAYSAIYLKKIP